MAGMSGGVPGGDPGARATSPGKLCTNGLDATRTIAAIMGRVDPAGAALIRPRPT